SSASTTTRPATRCRPPAKRSIAAASALRAEGRVTSRWLSSSFASPVSAMVVLLRAGAPALVLPCMCPGRVGPVATGLHVAEGVVEEITVRGGEAHRVVSRGAVAHADLAQQRSQPPGL